MKKRSLLDYIGKDDVEKMIPCFKPTSKKYLEGETILAYSTTTIKKLAVIMEGHAKLEIFNDSGEIFMLENYEQGDVFGELFSLPLDSFEYIVTALSPCLVVYIDYNHIIAPCSNVCPHHSQLISNLFVMSAQKSQELSLHISILGQPTMRGKILAYLKYAKALWEESEQESKMVSKSQDMGKNTKKTFIKPSDVEFTLPISLGELADYIRVDRTAMMRELRLMKKDGIIQGDRRQFRILV